MVEISEKEKAEIWYLYIYEFYSYEDLERHFKGKFSYGILKEIIKEGYKNWNKKGNSLV